MLPGWIVNNSGRKPYFRVVRMVVGNSIIELVTGMLPIGAVFLTSAMLSYRTRTKRRERGPRSPTKRSRDISRRSLVSRGVGRGYFGKLQGLGLTWHC